GLHSGVVVVVQTEEVALKNWKNVKIEELKFCASLQFQFFNSFIFSLFFVLFEIKRKQVAIHLTIY
ncbi:MAG: hypothetical protein II415_00795, partial [Bacteroidaceae bacterium]|nr:hypothetical protein [Bacteroidaceae bacterium]